jgi:hypothetical protein
MFAPHPCPECGKIDRLNKPGKCNYRWIKGDWVLQRGVHETADTQYISCDRCRVLYDENDGVKYSDSELQ